MITTNFSYIMPEIATIWGSILLLIMHTVHIIRRDLTPTKIEGSASADFVYGTRKKKKIQFSFTNDKLDRWTASLNQGISTRTSIIVNPYLSFTRIQLSIILAMLIFIRSTLGESTEYNLFNHCVVITPFNISLKILITFMALIVVTINQREITRIYKGSFFFFFQVMLSCLLLSTSTVNFLLLLVVLEIIALSSTAILLSNVNEFSLEAGIKYFFNNALAGAILMFGSALFYMATLSTNFVDFSFINNSDIIRISELYFQTKEIQFDLNEVSEIRTLERIVIALIFVIIALAMKIGAAPFHFWVSDVYNGASNTVLSILATIVKFAYFCILLNILSAFSFIFYLIKPVIMIITFMSLGMGSILASGQQKIKRLIACSSINHAGFIFALIYPMYGSLTETYVIFYLAVYMFSLLAFLGFLEIGSSRELVSLEMHNNNTSTGGVKTIPVPLTDIGQFAHLPPLLKQEKILFSIILLSLAGFPPFLGFYTKFLAFYMLSFVNSGLIAVCGGVLLISSSVLSIYYYTKIVKTLLLTKSRAQHTTDLIIRVKCRIHSFHNVVLLWFVTISLLISGLFITCNFDIATTTLLEIELSAFKESISFYLDNYAH